MDLAQILTGISEYAAGVGQQKKQVKVAQASNQDLAQQSIEAIGRIGDMKVQADKMNSEQALENENRKRAVASAFNVDMLDPENRIAALARQQAAEVDLALSQSRRASELNQMNIFDDPLSYMVQRPFAYRHAAEASAAAGRVQILDSAIDKLNTQAQQSVKTQAAINTEFTVAEAENQAKLVRMQADEAVRAAQMNKNISLIQDLKTLQGLDKQSLDAYTDAYKLKRHEQEFQARMEEMRLNREARGKAKKTEEEAQVYAFEKYNLGADLMGKAKMGNMAEFQMLYKKNPKFVQEIITRGEDVYVQTTEAGGPVRVDGRIARTPGEVIAALKQTRGNIIASAEKLQATYQDQYTRAVRELSKGGLTKITEEDIAAQVNKQLMGYTEPMSKGKVKVHEGLIKQMSQNVEQDWGGSPNIFRAPSPNVVGTVVPALVAEAGWEQIVKPASIAKPNPTVSDMMAQSKFAVLEGKLSVEQAAGFMASYYKGAMLANSANERYSRYAIPEDFNTRYKVTLPRVGTVDATNEAQLKRALLMNFTRNM